MTEDERIQTLNNFVDLAYTEEDQDMSAMLRLYVFEAKWIRVSILQSGVEL